MRIKSYSPVCSRFNGYSCKEILVKCHIHVCLNEHNLLTRKFHISFDKFGLQGVLCVFLKNFLNQYTCMEALFKFIVLLGKLTKVKVGVLRCVQQPGLYWDRSTTLSLVGVEPTQR